MTVEALPPRPRRPILTLAGLRPHPEPAPPPQPLLVSELKKEPSKQARSEQARPEQARPEQARPEQARPKQARPKKHTPAKATELMLTFAQEVQALLVRDVAVLPQRAGDQILPFKVGLGEDLLPLLKDGVDLKKLNRALGRYVSSGGYLLSCSRLGAMRCDLDGRPVETVSAEHRRRADRLLQARKVKRTKGSASGSASHPGPPTRA